MPRGTGIGAPQELCGFSLLLPTPEPHPRIENKTGTYSLEVQPSPL